MKNFCLLLLAVNALLVVQYTRSSAQSRDTVPRSNSQTTSTKALLVKIQGRVTDEKGEPFPGVTVKCNHPESATSSRADGSYSIHTQGAGASLTFSAIGYENQMQKVDDRRRINVKLQPRAKTLGDSIVVIGYGAVTKRDITGSVSKVDIGDLQKAPVKSIEEALAGRVAGVQVSSVDGKPGSESSILIRGATSLTQSTNPLYVIDGIALEDFNLSSIDPNDIQDIEVLKDASSTAIYGARGANGVIIITTKRGKDGRTIINYNAYYGFQKDLKRFDLMGPYDFVSWQNDFKPANAALKYLDSVKRTLDDYRNIKGVDWQKQIFQIAPFQNHSLSLLGGNKDTKLSISASIADQQGVIISSGYARYQGRVTLDHNAGKHLKVGLTASYSYEKRYGTPTSGDGSSQTKLLYNVYAYRPVNGKGKPEDLLNEKEDFEVVGNSDYRFNPVLSAKNELRNNYTETLNANAYGIYTFGRRNDFKLKIVGSIYRNLLRRDVYDNSQTRAGNPRGSQGIYGITGSVTYTQNNKYTNDNILTYKPKLKGGHEIDFLLGETINGQSVTGFGFGTIRNPDEELGIYGLREGTPIQPLLTSTNGSNFLLSGLFRGNYNYKHRYYLTASFRADGSSKFSAGNRWGYFPSGAVSWRFRDEPFFKNSTFLSDGKIRLSFGRIGNNRVDDYASIQTYLSTLNRSYQFENGTSVLGTIPANLANPGLKWETTSESNIGLDLGFFNQRLTVTAEVYRKVTNDLLLRAQEPLTTGLPPERVSSSGPGFTQENIGSLLNKGLELDIKSSVLDKKFKWSSSFNISFNRNKVLSLAYGQDALLSTVGWDTNFGSVPAYVAKVGGSAGEVYGYQWQGNYQYTDFDYDAETKKYNLKPSVAYYGTKGQVQPGWIKYRSLRGDTVIGEKDASSLGSAYPKFIGGFSNNFNYKGFDLNLFLQFNYGNKLINANRIYFEGGSSIQDLNQFASYANRWTPDNQNNEYFTARGGGNNSQAYSTRIVEDGSFLRLKTVSFGYTLPSRLLKGTGVTSLRIYTSAQNLKTWTKYRGIDPEVSTYQSALTPGFDFSTYPRARTIVFGINASF